MQRIIHFLYTEALYVIISVRYSEMKSNAPELTKVWFSWPLCIWVQLNKGVMKRKASILVSSHSLYHTKWPWFINLEMIIIKSSINGLQPLAKCSFISIRFPESDLSFGQNSHLLHIIMDNAVFKFIA